MPDATFATPDVTTFCRLDELGLVVVGQHLQPDRAVLACRVADDAVEEADRWCRRCGCEGRPRDTVTRRLAHEPLGWRPTTLLLTIRRYRCTGCGHVWRQDTSRAAGPRAKLTRTALRWALVGLVRQHLSVARLAEALAVSWTTANSAVLAEGRRVLLDDPARFDNVQVIGVDEHVWRHTRRGDRFVTVVIDLTPVRDRTGPSRLLAMVEGRSQQAFQAWLAGRPGPGGTAWRWSRWTGSPASRPPPATSCPRRRRCWTPSTSSGSPATLWTAAGVGSSRTCTATAAAAPTRSTAPACTLHTGADLLTDRQQQRLTALFGDEDHIQVQATWGIYQRMIAAYRHPDRAAGRHAMTRLIIALSAGVPAALTELAPSAGP